MDINDFNSLVTHKIVANNISRYEAVWSTIVDYISKLPLSDFSISALFAAKGYWVDKTIGEYDLEIAANIVFSEVSKRKGLKLPAELEFIMTPFHLEYAEKETQNTHPKRP